MTSPPMSSRRAAAIGRPKFVDHVTGEVILNRLTTVTALDAYQHSVVAIRFDAVPVGLVFAVDATACLTAF